MATDAELAAIGATALAYREAARNAEAVWMANGRRGASDAAVVRVNAARFQAHEAHRRMFDLIDEIAKQEPQP